VLEADCQAAIESTLRRFAAEIDETLFSGEGPDGDLTRVPQLLAAARRMGIVADPAPAAPGYELGVWGRNCAKEGLGHSLLTLSLLGEACAGFAAAVHAQGLGCLALNGSEAIAPSARFADGAPLAAVFSPNYGIPLSIRRSFVGSGMTVSQETDALVLDGTGHFLLAVAPPRALVCFAQKGSDGGRQSEWVALFVDADAAGTELAEVMPRTGLRACRQYHLTCNQVVIPAENVLHTGSAALRALQQVAACDWLGQAAIALGVARRSLRDSRAYTAQRYQGGRIIDKHASIQLLQGTAMYDIGLQEAMVYRHAQRSLSWFDPATLLQWAVQARLAVVEHAFRAVTDCLQTLGGYGYMEDYRFEKRLRDVGTLKSLHGAPDQLRLFLNELGRED
jgi:alkylation response protein AidB-like acyl-CoA dehydrogenase